jgi:hypothetical protein
VSLPSSYRSRRGHIHLLRVLPLVGCRSKSPTVGAPGRGDSLPACARPSVAARPADRQWGRGGGVGERGKWVGGAVGRVKRGRE